MVDLSNEVTVAEVETGIETQLSDSDIQDIIDESASIITGKLNLHDVDVSAVKTSDDEFELMEKATIYWARYTIFNRDASAFRKSSNIREGDVALGFSGNSQRDAEQLKNDALDLLGTVIRVKGSKRPKVQSSRRKPGQNPFEDRVT